MKKILMLLAFAGVASVASAQQTVTVTEYEVIQVQSRFAAQKRQTQRRQKPATLESFSYT